jgi:hypothetical protein
MDAAATAAAGRLRPADRAALPRRTTDGSSRELPPFSPATLAYAELSTLTSIWRRS